MDFLQKRQTRKNNDNDAHVQNFDRKLQSMLSLSISDAFYVVMCYCTCNLIQEPSLSLVLTKRIVGSRKRLIFTYFRKNKMYFIIFRPVVLFGLVLLYLVCVIIPLFPYFLLVAVNLNPVLCR